MSQLAGCHSGGPSHYRSLSKLKVGRTFRARGFERLACRRNQRTGWGLHSKDGLTRRPALFSTQARLRPQLLPSTAAEVQRLKSGCLGEEIGWQSGDQGRMIRNRVGTAGALAAPSTCSTVPLEYATIKSSPSASTPNELMEPGDPSSTVWSRRSKARASPPVSIDRASDQIRPETKSANTYRPRNASPSAAPR